MGPAGFTGRHGGVEQVVKKGITWLASFPKSGNTFMRVLLSNYLSKKEEPVDINSLIGGWHLNLRQPFEDYVGLSLDELSRQEISQLRARASKEFSDSINNFPYFIKTHEQYHVPPHQFGVFHPAASNHAIYLVRNPVSIVQSYAYHMGVSDLESMQLINNKEAKNPRYRGHQFLDQLIGSWSEHVLSWTHHQDFSVTVVRYEDLVSQTQSEFAKVLQDCQLPLSELDMARALECSAHEVLRKQEKLQGFREKHHNAGTFFNRNARVDNSLESALIAAIIELHGDVMESFSYRTSCQDYS